MPTLQTYEELLSLTSMNEEEKTMVASMPAPIAYGFIKAKREKEKLPVHPGNGLGDIFGGMFK